MTYQQEKIKPYNEKGEKAQQVEQMFDNIAPTYDLLNKTLSMGMDKGWRKYAVKSLLPYHPQHILDVATGTGDFALLEMQLLHPQKITGVDLSSGMLEVARKKVAEAGYADQLFFEKADCLQLPFEDNTFDAVTVAYGVRNFANLDAGLAEMKRVLKPGGRMVIIELSAPHKFPMKQLFHLYSKCYLSAVGRWISKDKKAYEYLPATMEAFPQGEAMQKIIEKAGFTDVSFKAFTGGLSTLYTAQK